LFKFIHIGLPKCASKTLQTLWFNDAKYTLVNEGILPVVNLLRSSTWEGNFPPSESVEVNVDKQSYSGDNLVLSSEGFSYAYNADNNFRDGVLKQYFENSSRYLGGVAGPKTGVLLMIRSPRQWLTSLYNQYIREGGRLNAETYLEKRLAWIIEASDLRFLVEAYRKQFRNISVIAIDRTVDGLNESLEMISKTFDVPVPNMSVENYNSSLSIERLCLLAQLNSITHRQMKVLNEFKSKSQEIDKKLRLGESTDYWRNRRFCELSSFSDIEKLLVQFNLKNHDGLEKYSFEALTLPNKLVRHLKANFIDTILEETNDSELARKYLRELTT
tara:strand:+ start:731 stop:1720 length:990 start_codon:yes stop_codon:yes gene_type:complete